MSRMKQNTFVSVCRCTFFVLMLLAVSQGISQVSVEHKTAKTAARDTELPGFSVKLTLSDKASKKLTNNSETIVVAGYLTCSPKQGTPERYVGDEGEIWLGQVKAEVTPGKSAIFEHVELDQDALKWADKQGPQLLINVYSGRKSSENNLLDCGIYQGSLQAVQSRSIPISCKLIGE
jgi:hypothetical protein